MSTPLLLPIHQSGCSLSIQAAPLQGPNTFRYGMEEYFAFYFPRMPRFPDSQRSYNTCPHCPDSQLTPNHIFNCPSILAKLCNVDLNPTDHQLLCSPKVVDIARAILDALGGILFYCKDKPSTTWTPRQPQ
ncbi:hypothetical protein TNCV_1525101 [Trichonephila clavipes]|nr:hypothetical protein TNCV_1525101 [Trichonephila clavipes]